MKVYDIINTSCFSPAWDLILNNMECDEIACVEFYTDEYEEIYNKYKFCDVNEISIDGIEYQIHLWIYA